MAAAEWKDVLEELTTQVKGKVVTIEVLDRAIGDQPEAERLPFDYAAYDTKDGALEFRNGSAATTRGIPWCCGTWCGGQWRSPCPPTSPSLRCGSSSRTAPRRS
ncbi:DUF5335 family protein [Lentzea sp. NBRC 102530]|uniref:DUF5335 family protein n=1 Tax=Lentzea sp. NBRC 102530 TaxID=3032201 RepID=UPI002556323A|nr:DUF5335 family protein [Lentzea sp. NBRC 102530]